MYNTVSANGVQHKGSVFLSDLGLCFPAHSMILQQLSKEIQQAAFLGMCISSSSSMVLDFLCVPLLLYRMIKCQSLILSLSTFMLVLSSVYNRGRFEADLGLTEGFQNLARLSLRPELGGNMLFQQLRTNKVKGVTKNRTRSLMQP